MREKYLVYSEPGVMFGMRFDSSSDELLIGWPKACFRAAFDAVKIGFGVELPNAETNDIYGWKNTPHWRRKYTLKINPETWKKGLAKMDNYGYALVKVRSFRRLTR